MIVGIITNQAFFGNRSRRQKKKSSAPLTGVRLFKNADNSEFI